MKQTDARCPPSPNLASAVVGITEIELRTMLARIAEAGQHRALGHRASWCRTCGAESGRCSNCSWRPIAPHASVLQAGLPQFGLGSGRRRPQVRTRDAGFHQTGTNDEAGLAQALQRFILRP